MLFEGDGVYWFSICHDKYSLVLQTHLFINVIHCVDRNKNTVRNKMFCCDTFRNEISEVEEMPTPIANLAAG